VLDYLSQTALILWVAESDWGYPIVLTLHSIGMALVVGILFMFDLRILGLARRIPFQTFERFFPIAWTGFVVNLVSGTLLFLANSAAFLTNTAFITKITMLCGAAFVAWLLGHRVDLNNGSDVAATASRALAAASLTLLLGAITAGRIIAYTNVPE
jgi:hypothetical protein